MRSRVLFIMHMPPPIHGAAMVGKYIHDSELINSEFECFYINPTTAKNLEDVSKFRFGKLLDVFKLIKRIKSKVREIQPDLVYFTANAKGIPFYKDYLIVRTLKRMGCRVVIHYHNKGVSTRQDRWLDNLLYKRFFKNIKIILLAEALYKDIEKYVVREDVQICGNGIPDLKPSISPLKGEYMNLLYLSNMMADKGVWTLLDACKELKRRGIDFHCNFVGGWKDITEVAFNNAIRQLGLTESVSAHGAKYGEEKEIFWQQASLFIMPSFNECFPLVILEAMQHQLPVVSTEIGGTPNIVVDGATGYLCPCKDTFALADAIEKLAKDRKLCTQMGKAGRIKYEEQFTLQAFEGRFVDCLKNIIE